MILFPFDLVFSTFSAYHFVPGIPEELMTAAFPLCPDAGQPAAALSTPGSSLVYLLLAGQALEGLQFLPRVTGMKEALCVPCCSLLLRADVSSLAFACGAMLLAGQKVQGLGWQQTPKPLCCTSDTG